MASAAYAHLPSQPQAAVTAAAINDVRVPQLHCADDSAPLLPITTSTRLSVSSTAAFCASAPLYNTACVGEAGAMGGDASASGLGVAAIVVPSAAATMSFGPPKLTWYKMTFICLVCTCGGPVGLEAVVKSGGPLLAIVATVGVVVFQVLPSVFIVTELSGMMPSNHGSVEWIDRAYGHQVGFVNSLLQSCVNMIDIAIYPVLIRDYLEKAVALPDAYSRYSVSFLIMLLASVPSVLSTSDLGSFSLVCMVVTMLPFMVGFFAGIGDIDPSAWGRGVPSGTVDISTLISVSIWMYSGFSSLGNLAGEVEDHRVFLVGCGSAAVLDCLIYLIPLSVTVQMSGDWDDGFFMVAFDRILPGLGWGILAAGAVSGVAMYSSILTCCSRALWGIADKGWLPRVLTRTYAPTGAPYVAMLVHMAACSVLMIFDFEFLVTLELVIYSGNFLLFFTSFVVLRYTEPTAHRPWRVPGGKLLPWLMISPIVVVNVALLVSGLADWRNDAVLCGIVAVLLAVYMLLVRKRMVAEVGDGGPNDDSGPSPVWEDAPMVPVLVPTVDATEATLAAS